MHFHSLQRLSFSLSSNCPIVTPSAPAAPPFSFTFSHAPHTRLFGMSCDLTSDFGSLMRFLPCRLITFAYQDSPAPWLRPHCDTRELHSYYGRVRQRVPHRYSAPPGFRRLESSLSPPLTSGSIGTRLHTFHTRASSGLMLPICRRPPGQ